MTLATNAIKGEGASKRWEVDITPDPSLLKKTGQQNYRIPDAIGELIDNEIDARITGRHLTVKVAIRMGKDACIIVEGNGVGMTLAEAERAMRLAHSSKSEQQIGEFGIGMKAACTNLGRQFEIITCTEDAESAIRIAFDEESFLKANRWALELQEVAKPFDHGTRVTIRELKVNIYAGLKDTLLDKFSRIFKHFLRDGDVEILVNDEPVVPEEPELLEQYTKPFAFEVQGHKVTGWYGLQKRYSQTGGYGFELIRNKRAMLRHEKIGFKPHPRLGRLVGEIHLDTFPVANNKMDFIRDTELWREFEETFEAITREIRGIAGKMASRKLDPKDKARIDEETAAVEEALNSKSFRQTLFRRELDQVLSEAEAEEGEEKVIEVSVEDYAADGGTGHGRDAGRSANGRERRRKREERIQKVKPFLPNIELQHHEVAIGADAPYKSWDVVATNPTVRLLVATNLDHPMYGAYGEDVVLWVKHNVVEAAAEYLCREQGIRDMLLMKSDILKHVGRLKIEEIEAAPTLS